MFSDCVNRNGNGPGAIPRKTHINWRLKITIIELYGSQQDFADRIGEYPQNVSQVINGRRNLSEKQKRQWSEALGHSVEYLFGDNDSISHNEPNHGSDI